MLFRSRGGARRRRGGRQRGHGRKQRLSDRRIISKPRRCDDLFHFSRICVGEGRKRLHYAHGGGRYAPYTYIIFSLPRCITQKPGCKKAGRIFFNPDKRFYAGLLPERRTGFLRYLSNFSYFHPSWLKPSWIPLSQGSFFRTLPITGRTAPALQWPQNY